MVKLSKRASKVLESALKAHALLFIQTLASIFIQLHPEDCADCGKSLPRGGYTRMGESSRCLKCFRFSYGKKTKPVKMSVWRKWRTA